MRRYVAPANGVWVKWTMRASGTELAQHRRDERQVVVLDQVDGSAVPFLRERDRERSVRLDELLPRGLGRLVERGRPRRVPQVVVEEPEDAVGHLVVVRVVAIGRDDDEPHALVGIGIDLVALGRDLAVAVRHGRGDPRGVVAEEHPRERRHEPSGAALRHERAGCVAIEAHRAAVGGHHDRRLHGAGEGAASPRAASGRV